MVRTGIRLKFIPIFMLFAIVFGGAYPFRPDISLVETDCGRILTEEQILVRQIAANSEDLKDLFSHYEEQTKNWQEFLNSAGAKGTRIHVLHQTGIKQLNEEIWNMTGTEQYLEFFHDLLHRYLKLNAHFGAVIHNDYKNHFVSSPLSGSDFQKLVVDPVIDQLILRMRAKMPEWDWDSWVRANIYHGEGQSPAEAYFRAALARARYASHDASSVDPAVWAANAVARRQRLLEKARKHGIAWDTMLAIIHSYLGRSLAKRSALERWLQMRRAEDILEDMTLYYDDLQVADFHPLPEASGIPLSLEEFVNSKLNDPFSAHRSDWTVERRALFAAAGDARFIAVTDVQGLGSIGRKFQDQWIGRGAKLDELQTVYAQSTSALEAFFAATYKRLREIIGPNAKLHVYRSGDDAVWFLPELSPKGIKRVRELFNDLHDTGSEHDTLELKLYYSNLIRIRGGLDPAQGVADALMRARASLFSGKKKYKPVNKK